MPKTSRKTATRAAATPKAPTGAERRSNAAEAQRQASKEARIRDFLDESRRREAELTRQGYCF